MVVTGDVIVCTQMQRNSVNSVYNATNVTFVSNYSHPIIAGDLPTQSIRQVVDFRDLQLDSPPQSALGTLVLTKFPWNLILSALSTVLLSWPCSSNDCFSKLFLARLARRTFDCSSTRWVFILFRTWERHSNLSISPVQTTWWYGLDALTLVKVLLSPSQTKPVSNTHLLRQWDMITGANSDSNRTELTSEYEAGQCSLWLMC